MNHIKQNDPGCIEKVQKIGCFVRTCGLAAEYFTGKSLTTEQINELWKWGKASEKINGNDCVVNSAAIMTRALRMLGDDDHYYAEIGTKQAGEPPVYYAWADAKGLRPDTFIQKILQNGPEGTHFRLVNERDELIEDPHDPVINVKAPVYTILYKVMYQGK